MSLVPLPELLASARAGGYAVGYFESWDVYTLEAVLDAAEGESSPVVIGIGGLTAEHAWLRKRGVAIYGAAAAFLARGSKVPTGVIFNEADSLTEAAGSLGAGYNAVMMHTQGWPWDRLVADTTMLVDAAHPLGIAVQGEVGALAEMRDGTVDESIGATTDVDQAVEFVRLTGVDCLAVAVGNVHFVTEGHTPSLDIEHLRKLVSAVDVPLVLHGGSGTPADQMRDAIDTGVSLFHVGTRLKRAYGNALREAADDPDPDPNLVYGSRHADDILVRASLAVTTEVRRLMNVFGSSGKAAP